MSKFPVMVRFRERLLPFLFFFVSVIFVLSVVSYDPLDTAVLNGGISHTVMLHNLLGWFGANIAAFFMLWFGFASYCVCSVFLLCSARRLFSSDEEEGVSWDYFIGLFFFILGIVFFLGAWEDILPEYSQALNLCGIPGGVIGQRFTSPTGGWIYLFANRLGSLILSVVLAGFGAAIIWFYDWHTHIKTRFTDLFLTREAKEESSEEKDPDSLEKDDSFFRKIITIPSILASKISPLLFKNIPRDDVEEKKVLHPLPKETRQAVQKQHPQLELDINTPENKPRLPQKTRISQSNEFEDQVFDTETESRGKIKLERKSVNQGRYVLPPLELLTISSGVDTAADPSEILEKKEILQDTLDSFKVDAEVTDATSGPRVTLFEVVPAPGVRVEKISKLSNNIAMDLKARSLRILTPIPGKSSVGIEAPNRKAVAVGLRGLMQTSEWQNSKARIPIILGKNIKGRPIIMDLAGAPHLLIAGATGSGKSVCINTIILSLLHHFKPDDLRMIMVDPKVVEFTGYKTLPHLIVPLVTDVKKVTQALRWIINEMERRYKVLAKVGVRNLEAFNNRPKSQEIEFDDDGREIPEKLPFIVLIIDELADIMMTAKKDVETSLARIAQLSRAVGIHTVIATQRPSVNVITGIIKANFPTRIAFQVSALVDSRTILDSKGAENLLGKGDMLFKPPTASKLERIQGAFVEDSDIEAVVKHVSLQQAQIFDETVFKSPDEESSDSTQTPEETADFESTISEKDEKLVQQAMKIIAKDRRATTSYVQRSMRIGYNRAATIMEILEERGLIGPQEGTEPREIFIDPPGDDET
ncbi:MAG: DNA translocase FtsK [Verrucomicrobiota bacterium]|nr:DNA translocase FtsK [Verrucomicrobiota bacterium]